MNVLFLDTVHPELERMLSGAGFRCTHNTSGSAEEIMRQLAGVHGLVIRSRIPINKELLNSAPDLKFIARAGAGLENIDVDHARGRDVVVFNVPEANRDAVGEHAIGMLLMLLNHLKRADMEVRHGVWRRAENRGTELGRLTVGIIGCGQMGSAFAEKLQGFGCGIIVYDKYRRELPAGVDAFPLEVLQQRADVISFHVPLTDETRYYFNDAFAHHCKDGVIIINTARGKVVETAALVRGLQSGKVGGACLDVLEYEGSSFEKVQTAGQQEVWSQLLEYENVLFSPHIAGWTHESHFKLSEFLGQKILQYFQAQK